MILLSVIKLIQGDRKESITIGHRVLYGPNQKPGEMAKKPIDNTHRYTYVLSVKKTVLKKTDFYILGTLALIYYHKKYSLIFNF